MYTYKTQFTDFFNNVREEEFRFNLMESELVDKDLTTEGGIKQLLEKMSQAQDIPALTRFFKEFLKASYGVISPDGRNFIKTEEEWQKFKSCPAYNELFMMLLQDEGTFALDFIDGVLPTKDPKNAPNNQNIMAIERAKEKALERANNRK